MVWNSPQLSLDLSPPVIDHDFHLPEFLTQFSITGVENFDELSKLYDFIDGLEDELRKIEAFKRELPISCLLLHDAIRKLKEKARKYEDPRRLDGKLEKRVEVKLANDEFDKKSWMSSAQLWSPTSDQENKSRSKTDGGAFSSFKEECRKEENSVIGLTLQTPSVVEPGSEKGRTASLFSSSVFSGVLNQTTKLRTQLPYQSVRKQRRCWSSELHRRFVDALESLGGPQVATPKQIRDLMQVDGLTNDEVKSHLQKYRLHVRKLPAFSTRTPSSSNEGGIDGHKLEFGCSTMDIQQSGSPESPLHFAGSRKCNSYSVEEDEEENSDGQSWKDHQLI